MAAQGLLVLVREAIVAIDKVPCMIPHSAGEKLAWLRQTLATFDSDVSPALSRREPLGFCGVYGCDLRARTVDYKTS